MFTGVLVLTLMPLDGIQPIITFDFMDKAIHFGFFLFLAIFLQLSYPKLAAKKVVLYLIIYGILIEILQHILPTNRSFDVWDAFFDGLGAICGAFLIRTLNKRFFKIL